MRGVSRLQKKSAGSASWVIDVMMEHSIIAYAKQGTTLIKADRISAMYRAVGQHRCVDADIRLIMLSRRSKNAWI